MNCKVGDIQIHSLPEPVTRWLPDNVNMEIADAYCFKFYLCGELKHAYIPMHFQFDGASIPRFAWATTGSPYVGKHRKGALCHDGAYSGTGGEIFDIDTEKRITLTRKQADDILLSACIFEGLDWYTRNKIYSAVRVFGRGMFQDGKG